MQIEAPFERHREVVKPEWIDHNGHLNVGFYVLAFDFATDAFLHWIGLDQPYREREDVTTFALEGHITYQREVKEGDHLRFSTQLLGCDEKRIHYFHRMFSGEENYISATMECLSLHVSRRTRRSAPIETNTLGKIEEILTSHKNLEIPHEVGRVMGLNSKTPTR